MEDLKTKISMALNDTGAYDKIIELVKEEHGIEIHADSGIWYEIEERIMREIKYYVEYRKEQK